MFAKRSYLIFCFSLCASSVFFAQNARERAVLDTELRRFEAMMRADTSALSPLLAGDLLYVHSNAMKENKTGHLQAIAARTLIYSNMERRDASIRLYGKTALINGTAGVKGILKGNPFEINLLYTALYRKNKGVWQLVNWQSTRIP
jgi:ketosteroid isomerase-like protein